MCYHQAQFQFKSYKAQYRVACRLMRLVRRASDSFNWSAGECNGTLALDSLQRHVQLFASWQTAAADPEITAIRQFVASKVR